MNKSHLPYNRKMKVLFNYIFFFIDKKKLMVPLIPGLVTPRHMFNPILFQFHFFQMLKCLPWKKYTQ